MAMRIIAARKILLDDERRVCYHNEADYDKGWLSPGRYKAIFKPEKSAEKQNKDFVRRINCLAASLVIFAGGAITTCTAGAAITAAVVCGAIFGGGFNAIWNAHH